MTTTHDASTRPHLEKRYAAAVEAEREADAEAREAWQAGDIEQFRAAERQRHTAKRAKNRLARQLERMNKQNWGCGV